MSWVRWEGTAVHEIYKLKDLFFLLSLDRQALLLHKLRYHAQGHACSLIVKAVGILIRDASATKLSCVWRATVLLQIGDFACLRNRSLDYYNIGHVAPK